LFALERQKLILDKLKSEGAVLVSKLSVELGVTEETVRRDLEKLEKQELLLRTHGGAVPLNDNNHEYSLEKRKNEKSDLKQILAKEAVKYIEPGDTIFLDASTTIFYIAKEIKNFKNVTVITNSLRILNELIGAPDLKVMAIGGYLSHNQSLVGSMAEQEVENRFFANKMFFSSRGVTAEAGILESNEQECAIKQRMIKNSNQKFFICDKAKIGRVGFTKLMPLSELDYMVTEQGLDDEFKQTLKENKVHLVEIQ